MATDSQSSSPKTTQTITTVGIHEEASDPKLKPFLAEQQQMIMVFQAILEKMPSLLLLHQNIETIETNPWTMLQNSSSQNSHSQKTYRQAANQQNPISEEIGEIIQKVGEIFDLYSANESNVTEEMMESIKQICWRYETISQQIAQIHNKLQEQANHEEILKGLKQNGIEVIMKQARRSYVRVIKYKYNKKKLTPIHNNQSPKTPQKTKSPRAFTQTPIQGIKQTQETDQQFIQYILAQIKKIKKYHATENKQLNHIIKKQENQLERCRMQAANILNKNQQLCEDINQLQERIKENQKNQKKLNNIIQDLKQKIERLESEKTKQSQNEEMYEKMEELMMEVNELKGQIYRHNLNATNPRGMTSQSNNSLQIEEQRRCFQP